MKPECQTQQLKREIEDVRRRIMQLGDIHPGSVSAQYHACGNPSCRCHDPENPRKHGPYNKLTYVHAGRNRCRFVRDEVAGELAARLENYRTLRRLLDRWTELAIRLGELELFPKRPDTQSGKRG